MNRVVLLLTCVILVSCGRTASKNDDLMSPCAGCDERVIPLGNLKYFA